MGEQVTCGRVTKAGTPCKNLAVRLPHGVDYPMPCLQHSTEAHRILREAVSQAYHVGYGLGERSSVSHLEWEIERRVREEFEGRECKHMRSRDAQGRQLVETGGGAYHWDGDTPLQVGDLVSVPPSEWGPSGPFKVLALMTDYTGPTKGIYGVVESAAA